MGFIANNPVTILFLLGSLLKLASPSEYLLDTQKCKVPNYQPFNNETRAIHEIRPYVECSQKDLLTFTKVTNNFATLHVREDAILQYYSSVNDVSCCYSYVHRNGSRKEPDVGIRFSKCKPFQSIVVLEKSNVMVTCSFGETVVYKNVHRPIFVTKKAQKKIAAQQLPKTSKPISVLMVAIDSVSRQSLQRSMNGTHNFLMENDFVDLKVYNKIDLNTLPNFMAILTGFNLETAKKVCQPHKVKKLDKCPMIWYDYRNLGYITAYAEDWSSLATFNYNRKGFHKPPTDYYFKPYTEASETLIETLVDTMPYCTGPESAGERILNLAKDFGATFKDNHPSFGIFWMNTFSHNDGNAPSRMDGKVAQFFDSLKSSGVLNESIVIFFSDHGVRFGDILNTKAGWFEERQPFNLISIPPWFKKQFPVHFRNLQDNANKLTSSFDLYMTLQDILVLSGLNYTTKASQACPTCTSLFSHIPSDRSCQEAGIPLPWCTCIGFLSPININSTIVRNSAVMVFKNIDGSDASFFEKHPENGIVSSSISETVNNCYYLLLEFKTLNTATYSVTVKIQSDSESAEIVRLFKNNKIVKKFREKYT